MNGACLCRRVTIALPAAPTGINVCNCDFCRRSGAAWGYYPETEVTVAGETRGFTRDDITDPWLIAHFCPTCGTTTHYTGNAAHRSERVGINMRLFDQDLLNGIAVIYQDGRAVLDETDSFVTTGTGHIGDGVAF